MAVAQRSFRQLRRRGRRPIGLALAAAAFVLPLVVRPDGLDQSGRYMLGIFLVAIVLWVTEAIPLHATAALIIFAEILLVSDEAIVSVPDDATPFAEFFAALAHPVLMLFLGGFFLAEGAAKFGLDRYLAHVLLRPFGYSPRMILLGLMLVTAGLSMFMSNTATTATLLAVMLPVIAGLDSKDKLRIGLALAIPIAANIGGIGTPVGTPPNAIAVGSLTDAGIDITFVRWMALAVPAMVILLAFAWFMLVRLFPPSATRLDLDIESEFTRSPSAMIFYVTFAATVALWLTEPFHGVNSSIIGFLPVVVLLATMVFSVSDLQKMPWHVLWLVAGGIALGLGVTATGLDVWFVDQVGWESIPGGLVALSLAAAALALSTVISNSAAANLLVPLGLTLALSQVVDLEPITAGFFIAIGASLAMALPVSTPPNAIAYSTGAITTGDMARSGLIVGVVGLIIFAFVAPLLWEVMGVSP